MQSHSTHLALPLFWFCKIYHYLTTWIWLSAVFSYPHAHHLHIFSLMVMVIFILVLLQRHLLATLLCYPIPFEGNCPSSEVDVQGAPRGGRCHCAPPQKNPTLRTGWS